MAYPEGPDQEGSPRLWREIAAQFARFSGLVAEIDDPLIWGLDLTEETVVGISDPDPTDERFLRSYWSPWRETVDVETLRVRAPGPSQAIEIARTALCSALAAPHHPMDIEADAFLDSYAEYRAAMRDIVTAADAAPTRAGSFPVDDIPRPAMLVAAGEATAVYSTVADRAFVVSGPTDLIERLRVVTQPIRSLLQDSDGRL